MQEELCSQPRGSWRFNYKLRRELDRASCMSFQHHWWPPSLSSMESRSFPVKIGRSVLCLWGRWRSLTLFALPALNPDATLNSNLFHLLLPPSMGCSSPQQHHTHHCSHEGPRCVFLHKLTAVFYLSLTGIVNWIFSGARCDPPIFSTLCIDPPLGRHASLQQSLNSGI